MRVFILAIEVLTATSAAQVFSPSLDSRALQRSMTTRALEVESALKGLEVAPRKQVLEGPVKTASCRVMVPIHDDGEPLVQLSPKVFSLATPHPYEALGAPYGGVSPWALRRAVVVRLEAAQAALAVARPGWRLHVLDALRPVAVQRFMVELTDRQLQREEPQLDAVARAARVRQFWAVPSEDPATPPPHSTGGAVDVTLVDARGDVVDMGSPFDEPTERSYPEHFASALEEAGRQAHAHRRLLYEVLHGAGFVRHPREWWHFSYGDQAWAAEHQVPAAYGNALMGRPS